MCADESFEKDALVNYELQQNWRTSLGLMASSSSVLKIYEGIQAEANQGEHNYSVSEYCYTHLVITDYRSYYFLSTCT